MSDSPVAASKDSGKSVLLAGAGILAAALLGFFLIFQFAQSEADQNMVRWQDRLNLVADSRAADVSTWLNRHIAGVEELASDATIQLYASQLAETEPAFAEGQRGYVYALMTAAAERHGFHEQRAIDQVAANVRRPQRAGLALLSSDGTPHVMTTGMPALRPGEWPTDARSSFISLGPQLEDKTPLVLFGAKVSAGEGGGLSTETGLWIVGARPLDADFLATLEQPGAASKTGETYLVVAQDDDIVRPLTPLKKGGRIGEARVDVAAAFAAREPGGFAIHPNYTETDVLVTGRELSAPVPWILVRTITAEEALAEINERRNSLIITLSLAALFVLAALVMVWRHGVSQRLEASYREQAQLSAQNEALSRFLQSVSDNQPTAIAALDENMTVHLGNKQLGKVTGLPAADLANRRLDTAFPKTVAETLRAALEKAQSGQSVSQHLKLERDGVPATFQADMLPLKAEGGSPASALLVMQDISSLVAAKEQSETLFKQLVSTLTQIIDARDPWSKHHSDRVADVAQTIAAEMGWQNDLLESVRIAGQLVNLGKIFVPSAILTKQTPLSDEELALVRDSMQKGATLVAGLDFKGPVADILAQMREHWDGSGEPSGLKGEEIEPGARILAVANAFVGMVSARAHRKGLGFDRSLDILNKEAGTHFERRVVAALQNVLENKGGRERFDSYTHIIDENSDTNS